MACSRPALGLWIGFASRYIRRHSRGDGLSSPSLESRFSLLSLLKSAPMEVSPESSSFLCSPQKAASYEWMSAKPDRKAVPKRTSQPSLLVMITCGGHSDTITNTFLAIERRTVMTQPSTRILVLGAGIAGLLFTLRLAGKVAGESVQITLIDESDTFTVRPRLQEFATNQRIFSRPFSQILRKTQVQFLQGRVTSLDSSQHRSTVQDQQQQQHDLSYDF